MSKLERQLVEDRALRNSARKMFRRELDHARNGMNPTALGERLGEDVGRRVDEASDGAIAFTERHGGKIAATGGALAAGIGLWLARKPILARLTPLFGAAPFSQGEAALSDRGDGGKAEIEDSHDE
jgi:hypothetical protein